MTGPSKKPKDIVDRLSPNADAVWAHWHGCVSWCGNSSAPSYWNHRLTAKFRGAS